MKIFRLILLLELMLGLPLGTCFYNFYVYTKMNNLKASVYIESDYVWLRKDIAKLDKSGNNLNYRKEDLWQKRQ